MRPIASLQCLRAFAALLVVVGHCQTEAAVDALKRELPFAPLSVLPWGAGVDLFFVISGFIMVVASRQLFAAPGAAAAFTGRRLKRIVPLYWLCTTLYVLIRFATHEPVAGVVASYLFWPADTFGDGVPRPILALGWTLNYEMAFYALFALALRLPRRGAVALVTTLLLAAAVAGQASPPPAGPLWFWTRPIVLEFAAGMAVGAAWCEGWRLAGAARLALAAAALATWALDPMGSAHQAPTWITPTDGWRLAAWGGPAVALLAAAVLARGSALGSPAPSIAVARVPTKFVTLARATIMLGDASYALYLVHPFVVGTLMRAWTLTGAAQPVGYAPFVAASLVASAAAAFAVHRWIERPIADALARWPGRPSPAAVGRAIAARLMTAHGKLARVPEIAAWVLIAALAIATIRTMAVAGLSVDPASLWRPGVPCLALIGGAAIYRSVRPDQRIAAALMAVAQLIAFTALAALWSYAMASTGGALWDDTLQSWDRALGLNWRAYLDLVNSHPRLALLYGLAYQSLVVQTAAAAVILGLTGRLAACRVFVLASIIAGCATVAISGLMPANSMFVHLGLEPGAYDAIDTTAVYAPLVPFNNLRNGTLHVISLASMEGIISFPSFHATLGVIFLATFWQVWWARWPAVVLNVVLIAATPINGGHYFVDVMAGVLVAVTAVLVASRLDRVAQGARGRAVAPVASIRTGGLRDVSA